MSELEIKGEVKNFKPAPAGNHVAICVGVAMIGTVKESFNGKDKMMLKVAIMFELCGTKQENSDKPFVMTETYTLSMGSTANLRKMLESWRGEKFTDKEAENFNIVKVAGAPCLCCVVKDTKDGKERTKISAITPLPTGTPVPAKVNELTVYQTRTPFMKAEFDRLPKWIQTKIEGSEEFKKLGFQNQSGNTTGESDNNPFAKPVDVTTATATKLF